MALAYTHKNAPKRRKTRWRWLRRVLYMLLLLLVILLSIVWWILGTESGTRTGFRLAKSVLAEHMLEAGKIEGSILNHLRVTDFMLRLSRIDISFDEAVLDLQPQKLLKGQLDVNTLSAKNLLLVLKPPVVPKPPADPNHKTLLPAVVLPVPIRAEEIRVDGFKLIHQGAEEPIVALTEGRIKASFIAGKVRVFSSDLHLTKPQVEGQVTGTIDLVKDYPMDAYADGLAHFKPNLTVDFKGPVKGDFISLKTVQDVDGTFAGKVDAEIREIINNLGWSGTVHVERSRLTDLGVKLPFTDAQGDIKTDGHLYDYRYELNLLGTGKDIPDTKFQAVGKGSLVDLLIQQAQLENKRGKAVVEGKLDFKPLAWDTKLALTDFDPSMILPDWPGKLNGNLNSQGTLHAVEGIVFDANVDNLHGKLRQYDLSLDGQVEMQQGQLNIQNLLLKSGATEFNAHGIFSAEHFDADYQFHSPDLTSLLPELKGKIKSSGKLRGSLTAPDVDIALQGDSLAYGANSLGNVTGAVILKPASNQDVNVNLNIQGKNLQAGGQAWSQMLLEAKGLFSDHAVKLSLTGKDLNLGLDARNALNLKDFSYLARLNRLEVDSPSYGRWHNEQQANLFIKGSDVNIKPSLCLRERKTDSRLCGGFSYAQNGEWQVRLDDERLQLDLLKNMLPSGYQVTGRAIMSGQFSGKADRINGQARLSFNNAILASGKQGKLDLSATRLVLDAKGKGLSAVLDMPVRGLGEIRGNLALPGWTPTVSLERQALTGRVRANVPNLAAISWLIPDIDKLKGSVALDLALSGRVTAPQLSGNLALEQIGFVYPLTATRVSELGVRADISPSGNGRINGQGLLGGKQFTITGDIFKTRAEQRARIQVAGNRLKAADNKEYFMLLTPDIKIDAGASSAQIAGRLVVPEARIRPRMIPNSAKTPSPYIYVKKNTRPAYPLTINMQLELGRDVSIDGFGLRGMLGGKLDIFGEPGKPSVGNGQLQIKDAEYRLTALYGVIADLAAPLTVRQGRLIFSRSPLNNPGLYILAERTNGSTSAALKVQGTLKKPDLAMFSNSNPELTQADITKFLLTGIPPDTGKPTEAGVSLGTYISPKIYVEYGVGLGDDSSKARVRYDVSPHVELQLEGGKNQGGDIFFKFEH